MEHQEHHNLTLFQEDSVSIRTPWRNSGTQGCPKCEALRRDDREHKGHHSNERRKRVEEWMKEDPELKKKLQTIDDKQDRWIGRRIEAQDQSKPPPEQASAASVPGPALPLDKAL